MAGSELNALCNDSVANVRPNARLSPAALVAEATGAALVVFGALASGSIARCIGGDGPAAAYVTIGLLGLCVLAAILLVSSTADGYANPLVTAFRIDDTVCPDDAVRVILAQLGAASVVGLIAGLLGTPSETLLTGGFAAQALASACFVATALAARTRTAPALVAITAGAVAGPTCIGSPAVALGLAAASAGHGKLVNVGAILGAQLLGAVVGAVFAALRDATAIAPTTGI